MKSQNIRLIDAFVLGPLLMRLSGRSRLSASDRSILWWIGAATVAYNLANYLALRSPDAP